jgi:hypothetical protein
VPHSHYRKGLGEISGIGRGGLKGLPIYWGGGGIKELQPIKYVFEKN